MEIEPAALSLLQRHGATIMATARRFAATPEDAEDAYQRGVEILLTKAPTTSQDELVPWLRTVVKHEAWALRRQRQRSAPVADDGEVPDPPTDITLTHDQAERIECLRRGAEAMRHLKPQEVRALLLKAEGYSYSQIQDITGWTYTKVNRCLTEGRRAFFERVAGIEAGAECERLAPLLSKLVDGEAVADDMAKLRPHLRTCLACRAALREFRAAPRTAAALVPVAMLAAPGRPPLLDAPARLLESLAGWTQKAHTAVELASAQKVAAVAASTAVLAGGGAAVTVEQIEREPKPGKHSASVDRAAAVEASEPPAAPIAAAPPAVPASRPTRRADTFPPPRDRRSPRDRREERALAVERSTAPAEQEFEPAWADPGPAPAGTARSSSTAPARAPEPAPSAGGAEEFAP